MANNCFYDMHIVGKKDDVDFLIDKINAHEVGRIFSLDVYEYEEKTQSDYPYMYEEHETHAYASGDCAWSIWSSFLNNPEKVFENIIKERKLTIEMYSEEPGVGFMEHYMWEYGARTVEEERDYTEYYTEDIEEDPEYFEEFLSDDMVKQKGITKNNYKNFADEGWIKIGGFDWVWTIN